MKRIFTLVILLAFIQSVNAQFSSNKYVENELIIWLDTDADPYEFAKNFSQDIHPKRELSKRLNIWLFEFKNPGNQRSTRMNNLRLNNKVKYVQNNHMVSLRAITPDDEYYGQQWAPSVIHLPEVWDEYTTGGTSADGDDIVIAVIDGGFDLAHEDLNFWKNTNEIPGNGIDDDNNGYIDDYDGWNAYASTGNIPNDNHGTHVAGIAGAIGNNDTGISGVNWNVGILPVAGSSRTEATIVEAYSYILEMRALYNETNGQSGAFIVVTNSSFGVDLGDPDDFPIWCSMYDELGSEGILNCAATANANWNIDEVGDVPTTCSSEFLIAVTNTTSSDNKYPDAGYGITHIDLGAPGTNIYSTFPGDNYENLTGTSMACPQVAGVIALMYASMCQNMIQDYKNNPGDFALMIRQYLLEGADNLPSLNGLVAYGRLNALEAIENIFGNNIEISGPDIVCATNTTFSLTGVTSGLIIDWDYDTSVLTEVGDDDESSYVVRANSSSTNGEGWVRVNIITGCGDTITLQQDFWVGELDENKIVCSREGQASGAWAQYHILCDEGSTYAVIGYDANGDGIEISDQQTLAYKSITEYDWDVPSGWSWSEMNNSDVDNEEIEISPDWGTYPSPGDMVQIGVRVRNGCNWTSWVYDNWVVVTCSGGGLLLAITPNPTTGETTLSIESESEEKTFDKTAEWEMAIYDQSQLLKEKKTSLRGKSTKIQTAGWKEGVYMVRVKYKDEILTGKLVVKK